MSLAIHCDRDGCTTWQRLSSDLPSPFLTVTEGNTLVGHFCSLDHLLHFAAANSEPNETVT